VDDNNDDNTNDDHNKRWSIPVAARSKV